jgi:hypothetical protein
MIYASRIVIGLVALVLAASCASAAPFKPLRIDDPLLSAIKPSSFWSLPYPYGYRYRSGCLRYVRVHTPHGWRKKRVWVCM